MNIQHYIRHPDRLLARMQLMRGSRLSDEKFIELSYYNILGRRPDLVAPVRYTEKTQWFKLHCRDLRYVDYVDKLAVRRIVEKEIGGEYLIPILGRWDSFEDIDFEKLPDQFVLKCNHDSHSAVICRDRSSFDRKAACRKLTKALKTNFYHNSREWLYSNIVPCIIAEEYIEDSGGGLRDYKFWCFHGEVKFVNVLSDREKRLKIAAMTRDWRTADFINDAHLPVEDKLDKPQNYEEMLRLAEFLSRDFAHVRMDFYNVDGKIYFGEYTFTPASGFQQFLPDRYDAIIGAYWDLTQI